MSMQEELKAIWDTYAAQREADLVSNEIARKAVDELKTLNARRHQVDPPTMTATTIETPLWTAVDYGSPSRPRTWRDDMDDALLSCVKRHMDPVVPT